MKIAVEGCAHGELEKIYESIQLLERKENIKIDLLICCGDFQSTRNLEDLRCMAVPPKYYNICTFYKYYTGEKRAPILTIFIGGNHEASNYLQELPYGGWVAPNIFYLGYANVINVAGVRIAGISGIFKGHDYFKGHFEKAPYTEDTKRSVYHIRSLEVYRLKQISQNVDIFLSHDWPSGIHRHGHVGKLLKFKPFLREDIESNKLGSPPCEDLLNHLKPNFWFAAHLHCKFAALVTHSNETNNVKNTTKFLALDKCLPKRKFLQVIDILHEPDLNIEIKYDLEWLTILYLTNHLLSVKNNRQYMPGPGVSNRWMFTPTQEEKDLVLQKFDDNLVVPSNFVQTATAYDPSDNRKNVTQPNAQTNSQTTLFCEKLGIDDPTHLVLLLSGADEKSFKKGVTMSDVSVKSEESISPLSYNRFIPQAVEIKHGRLNMSLPEPKSVTTDTPKRTIEKLSVTLPAPKFQVDDLNCSNNTETDKDSQESDISDNSLNTSLFSVIDISTSTPQKKKFKRRNESIYKQENE